MLKKILFLATCLVASAHSMNNEMQPLVKPAHCIRICAPTLSKKITFRVGERTTILDIKQEFQEKENIPVEQQTLRPLYNSWLSLQLIDHQGSNLADSQTLKEIAARYHTLILLVAQKKQ